MGKRKQEIATLLPYFPGNKNSREFQPPKLPLLADIPDCARILLHLILFLLIQNRYTKVFGKIIPKKKLAALTFYISYGEVIW